MSAIEIRRCDVFVALLNAVYPVSYSTVCAGKVWDATYGLLEFFADQSQLLSGKVVVELGSGTGLAGGCCCCC